MRLVALLCAVTAVGTLAALPALPAAGRTEPWEAAVDDLLARRSRAVAQGNEDGFAATMTDAPASFRRQRLLWFARIRELPVAGYVLERDGDGFGDLGPALPRRRGFDEIRGVEVIERISLRGYDRVPTAEGLYLTVGRKGDRWSVLADDDLEDIGLWSARDLWDFGEVRTIARGGVLVVYHPGGGGAARRILDATRAAVSRIRRDWPFEWPERVVVHVPRTSRELARILQTSFDLGPFVAFASSSVDRRDGGWRLGGHRVYVQPGSFFAQPEASRGDILAHEVLHIATRDMASPYAPSWLEEGVAQHYGEGGAAVSGALAAHVGAGRFDGALPDDAVFTAGDRGEIRFSYEASYDFVRWLSRDDRRAGARLYRALGRRDPVSPGTWRYHLDRAVRDVFGSSFRALEGRWAARVEREFS